MKYTVERTDKNGKIIKGYKREIDAGGAYQAFQEWIDVQMQEPSPFDEGDKIKDAELYHSRVTELEGKKRTFAY